MSNLRFHHPEDLHIGANIKLSDNAATHATKVMRLNVGDTLTLFCGDGADYTCELTSVQKSAVMAQVKAKQMLSNESPLNITLLLGISAGDRMDIAIQKAVELGVNNIVPIKTERSVVKLDEDKAKKRVVHWQNIAIAACEQSGRAVVPSIAAPTAFNVIFTKSSDKTPSHLQAEGKNGGESSRFDKLSANGSGEVLRITLDPLADKKLADLLTCPAKPSGEIQLLIGAEGGLSPNEIALANQHGFIGVQLGKRILRTETAPLAAIAAMNTLWGDF